ncbi:hypothetical protein RDI58_003860 [Solanum bulbocastanum]|uniref:Uncharacterized protein n=1 Tax=Solanum bulbocastanum TaxID=147425 RepID=A0AAN8U0G0_SOLBU
MNGIVTLVNSYLGMERTNIGLGLRLSVTKPNDEEFLKAGARRSGLNLDDVKSTEATKQNEKGVPGRKNWKGLFQDTIIGAKGMELSYVPLVLQDGKPLVKLSEEDVEIGNETWSIATILYVIRNTPSIGAIMRFIATEWNFMAKPKEV